MGEVISYTKVAIDQLFVGAAIVGSDLVLTRKDATTLTLDLSSTSSVDQSDIDAAVAALVAGAPGTLDTLDELAAALGDDANLAATLAANIAAVKAGAVGGVVHGATAGTARPAGYALIHWVGSVTPTNAIDNDVWTDTSA